MGLGVAHTFSRNTFQRVLLINTPNRDSSCVEVGMRTCAGPGAAWAPPRSPARKMDKAVARIDHVGARDGRLFRGQEAKSLGLGTGILCSRGAKNSTR